MFLWQSAGGTVWWRETHGRRDSCWADRRHLQWAEKREGDGDAWDSDRRDTNRQRDECVILMNPGEKRGKNVWSYDTWTLQWHTHIYIYTYSVQDHSVTIAPWCGLVPLRSSMQKGLLTFLFRTINAEENELHIPSRQKRCYISNFQNSKLVSK